MRSLPFFSHFVFTITRGKLTAQSGVGVSISRRVYFTGHGSQVTGHGSRVTGHGSQVTGHGSQVTGHGSRVAGHGSRVTDL